MIQRKVRKNALGLATVLAFGMGGLATALPAAAQGPAAPAAATAAYDAAYELGTRAWMVDQMWPYSSASERTSALAKCESAAEKALASGKYSGARCEDVPKKAVVLRGYRSKAS